MSTGVAPETLYTVRRAATWMAACGAAVRVEALNNNRETLVHRGRGYRDHEYLLLKVRIMVANLIGTDNGIGRPTRMAA